MKDDLHLSADHKVIPYFKTLTLFFPKYGVHKVVVFKSNSRVMTLEKNKRFFLK
ncbi:hypothetical protein CP061683_0379 [Chlamydia psittaci 06-1683]|nr:hypothetical protein CP061683_0379 [Chlamydia psittaci 06-1683]